MASAAKAPAKSRDARQLRSDAALRAAMLSLLPKMSFDKMSVRDIVAEAGIGYATFFRHYPSKDALLDAVAGEEIAGMMALTSPLLTPSDTLSSCIALAEHVGKRRDVWKALLTGGASGHLRDQFVRLAAQVPGPGHDNHGIPTDLGVTFGVSATVEILAWWLRQEPDYPAEKVAELLDRLVISPTVGPRAGN